MTLDEDQCWKLVASARHGSLSTVHPTRGVDVVPVVYAVLPGRRIVVPVDAVKPKTTARLQRVVNLERDSRCVLLVDHYEEDWSRLWWVRAHSSAVISSATPEVVAALAARFTQYEAPGTVISALILTPATMSGWSARTASR